MALRTQFYLAFSLISGLVTIVTALLVYSDERRVLETMLLERGRESSRILARVLVEPVYKGDFKFVQEVFGDLSRFESMYGLLMDPDGRVLAHWEGKRLGEAHGNTAAAQAVLRHFAVAGPAAEVAFVHDVYNPGTDPRHLVAFREFAARVRLGDRDLAFVRLGYDRARLVDDPVRATQLRITMILLGALALGAAAAWALSRRIVQPVAALVGAAQALAKGQFDAPLDTGGSAEIAVLGEAMDVMRNRIQEQIGQIRTTNAQLDRKVYELEVLYDVARTMNFKGYSMELLDDLLDKTVQALGATWGSLMLMSDESDRLQLRVVRGVSWNSRDVVEIQPGQGLAGLCFEKVEPLVANEGWRDSRFLHIPGQERFEQTIKNMACAPLLVESRPIGVLNVVNRKDGGGFDQADIHLLTALASQAARALQSAKLYDLAIRECKTGLFVPSYFEARVQEQITVSRRYSKHFALIMIDVDHFKSINDTHGHIVGDEVLVKIARFIKETLRQDIDIACRFGGEEFLVLLPETDATEAHTTAGRLRKRIEDEVGSPALGPERVTASFGVSVYPTDGVVLSALKTKADEALYAAKRQGRNRVVMATPLDLETSGWSGPPRGGYTGVDP